MIHLNFYKLSLILHVQALSFYCDPGIKFVISKFDRNYLISLILPGRSGDAVH